jgi:RNase P subunit RPR2
MGCVLSQGQRNTRTAVVEGGIDVIVHLCDRCDVELTISEGKYEQTYEATLDEKKFMAEITLQRMPQNIRAELCDECRKELLTAFAGTVRNG